MNRCAICPGNCYREACPLDKPYERYDPVQRLPRTFCELGKGPCNGDCYGNECALRLSHVPWPEVDKPKSDVLDGIINVLIGIAGAIAISALIAAAWVRWWQ